MDLAEDVGALLATVPARLRPGTVVDESGKVSVVDASIWLGTDGPGVASLMRRGHLRGTRKDDGSWWFDPADVEAARPFVRRGRGRPAIGEAVEVRLPPSQLAEIDQLANDAGLARAEVIRRLIAAGLTAGATLGSPPR